MQIDFPDTATLRSLSGLVFLLMRICNVHTLVLWIPNWSFAVKPFEWDTDKAASNLAKHGVTFLEVCEVFFDPFFRLVEATVEEEAREAAIGYTEDSQSFVRCPSCA